MKKLNYILLSLGTTLLLSSCLKEYENPAEGQVNDKAPIYVVRTAFRGNPVTLNEGHLAGATFTSGTVISDKSAGNIQPGTFIIQNTSESASNAGNITTGIVIDMGSGTNVPFIPGDSVLVNIIGGQLQRVNGQLMISGITADKVTKVAENKTVVARPVTLAMLTSNFINYESTLVSVHADASQPGSTYSGEKQLNDNTATALLYTRSEASFAGSNVPVNAKFTGIAAFKNDGASDTAGAKKTIQLRTLADVANISGAIYAGFPESFETPDVSAKASYNITATANNIDLSTGNWKLQQAILANTILSDKINLPGKQNVRMQQNLTTSGYVQMNFDLLEGASKVTVFYGRYSTDPSSSFRLEYSTNSGTSWTVVTPTISNMPERGSTQATFMVNVTGKVRFRINKLGLGASSATVQNGRLSIEDFSVYKKL
jgi:urease beta subunit